MIRFLNVEYDGPQDLGGIPREVLEHPRERVLVQVFSGVLDEGRIRDLIDGLNALMPGVAILGTTTGGEIAQGRALENSILLNITWYEHSTVRTALARQNDDLPLAGRQLAQGLRQPGQAGPEGPQALIVFNCGVKNRRMVFAESLLDSLREEFPEATMAGGQAGDNGRGERTLVFTGQGITDSGAVAASISGPSLSAHGAFTLSWVPIGKKLTITKAEGSRVYAIDGRSPYEIYCHYLGQEVADGLPMSAADFPLMVERGGVLMAIHATGVNPDGSFEYIHHFRAGEQLRFGYCHAGLLALGAEMLREELAQAKAEAAFVYSCVSRKWILGADVLVELRPIETLAPSAGFFCYGEYSGRPRSRPLFLSQTMTVLTLAEGGPDKIAAAPPRAQADPLGQTSKQFRTLRVLHRLVETTSRELESMNEELAGMARRDSLTGLANRRLFDERLLRELKRHSRSGAPLSLVMLDLDHFKLFNDTYGHVLGDACLRAVTQVIQEVTRRAADIAARYGGEEFAVILPETGHQAALALAEEVRRGIERLDIPHETSPTAPCVTVSLGVVTARPDRNSTPEELVTLADRQMYLAKSGGRNRTQGVDRQPGESGQPG